MEHRKLEIGMPIFFILLAAGTILQSFSMAGTEGHFPRLIGVLMLVVAAVILGDTIVRKKENVNLEGMNLPKVAQAALVIGVYILAVTIAGYMLASVLFGSAIMYLMGYRRPVRCLLISLVTVAVVFFVFKILLAVPLPLAFLDF